MIVPLLHRILVKQEKLVDTDKTYARAKQLGLVLTETDDHKRAQAGVDKGTIIAIGATAYKDYGVDPPISVGMVVAFAKYSGKIVTDPDTDEEYVLLNDEDIVCVITRKE